MKTIEWLSEKELALDGVRFMCSLDDFSLKTNTERLILLKDREGLNSYQEVFAGVAPKNVLEFGIFQGGSPALFSLWFELDKLVGIDWSPPVAGFEEFCRTHEVGKRIRSYYGVSQTDRLRVEEIVRTEFGATPLDAVIDDASHLYATTRQTFEIAFPLLRPGGIYVIEDWGWAHWPGSRFFMGETALSMLVMELIMLCAARRDLVAEVRAFPNYAFVRKSSDAKSMPHFRLDELHLGREIELVGTQNLNLGGVAHLIARNLQRRASLMAGNLKERARYRAKRTARKLQKAVGYLRSPR
jgi:SAM-dependent methyltransferase